MAQREIRVMIDAMPGRPEEKLLFCPLLRFEAPNIRTVTYDFADVTWVDVRRAGVSPRLPVNIRSVAWVCDGAGLPDAIRARFPQARKIFGSNLYSFWTAPANKAQLEATFNLTPAPAETATH